MKIFIFTLDDNNATRFIDKRQSLDKNVADKILLLSTPHSIWIKKKSESFFDYADFKPEFIYFKAFDDLSENCIAFFEEPLTEKQLKSADMIYVFKWNTKYPSLNIDRINLDGFKKISSEDFEGNSHPKITLEEYIK